MKKTGFVRTFLYSCTLLFLSSGHALQIGDSAPDFTANTSEGLVDLHDWGKDKYILLFSHPLNFTPVCTTELAEVHKLKETLDAMDTAAIGLSVDSVERHSEWEKDILFVVGDGSEKLNFPLIGDNNMEVAKLYGMMGEDTQPGAERTARDNQTARTVFLIGKDRKIKMMLSYPMTTGRNFDEIVRILKSIQLTDKHMVATPANWQAGDDVVLPPALETGKGEEEFGKAKVVELPSSQSGHKDYLRFVKAPN